MQDTINISCPVSAERINENAARAAAFFTIVIAAAGMLLNSYIIIILLASDFALRAFTQGKASPVKLLAKQVVQLLKIKEKSVDAAPKKFAAGVGMVFCLGIAAFQLAGLYIAANITGGVLLFCALLEGGAGICLGCIAYTLLIVPFNKQK